MLRTWPGKVFVFAICNNRFLSHFLSTPMFSASFTVILCALTFSWPHINTIFFILPSGVPRFGVKVHGSFISTFRIGDPAEWSGL